MSDVDTSADAKTRAISKRDWLNDKGERINTGDASVAGIRYTYLANGKSVEFMFADSPQLTNQFAAMGGLTKIGNVVNSVVNAEDYDASDPMESAGDWLAEAVAGQWREPGEGPRGPKYDNATLAFVLAAAAKAAGKDTPEADYLSKLANDKKYRAKVLQVTAIMDAYKTEAESRGLAKAPVRSVDDVL